KYKIDVISQSPNQEGVFLRMFPKHEHLFPDAVAVKKLLNKLWPGYIKPVDARTLSSKFSFNDLRRAATKDPELQRLLQIIGLRE
ncbi:MAG: hypothetical protein ACK4PR_09480, partial [Gammaproteobacteria bacterium]